MKTAERTSARSTETVYDGFISYSHAADDLLAPRLQSGLQRFAKPWWKRRALRVFRDESSLSANPHLWSSITEALDSSGWFVLLLSPDAAQSEWVNQEIEYWKQHKEPSRILPVLTDGTFEWVNGDVSGTALPEQLRGSFAEEPRWVDMRFARDEADVDLKDPRFADAVADIASALRGVPKDELASEEVKQHRRTIRTAWVAGVLVLLLGAAAGFAAIQASQNASEAERQAEIAEQNAALAAQNEEQALAQAERADANAAAEAQARSDAEASAQLAKARELAASAIGVLDEDPRLATWLALTAIDQTPEGEEQPVEVMNALWKAVAADPHIATVEHGFGGNTFVDVSPDGETLAITSAEGAVLELRSAETFETLWEYSEDTEDGFARPVFSPDGALIAIEVMGSQAEDSWRASGVDDLPNRVLVIDSAAGEPVQVLEYPECQNVWAPAWSPDGSLLAVSPGFPRGCEREGVADPIWIEVFDVATWESRGVISIEGDDFAVRAIFLSDDRLGAFRSHNPLQAYDTATLERVEVMEEVANPVTPAVSIGGSLIAAHSNETLLGYVYDLETGSQLDILGDLEAWPTIPFGVSFSRDGRLLSFSTDGRVLVWDTSIGEQVHQLNGGAGAINAAFSPDGTRLYSAHRDGAVRVWSLSAGGSLVDLVGSFPPGSFVNGNGFEIGSDLGMLVRFEFAPEFITFIEFFSSKTGELTGTPLVTEHVAVLLPNDLVVGRPVGSDTHLLYDPETADGERIGPDCGGLDCAAVISANRQEFAIVHETSDGSLLWNFFSSDMAESVGSVAIDDASRLPESFGDSWVVTGDPDGNFAFFDRTTGEELLRIGERSGRIEYSNDARMAALRPNGRLIVLVDTETWETTTLDLGFGRMRGLTFSPDDSLLAAADEDELLIVDVTREEIVQEIPIPLVSDIHWINDGTLLVADRDGGIWGTVSLDTEQLINRARKAVADRPLTDQECATYRIDPCPTLER